MRQDSLNKLSLEEMQSLSPEERSRYYERYLFELIKLHSKEGLTQAELEKITGINANTLGKYLELLSSKRKVYRSKKGRSIIYYPNGKIAHSLSEKDLTIIDANTGFEKRYRFYLIENPEGQQLYIQEKEIDNNGFENVVAGITISKSGLYDFVCMLNKIEKIDEVTLKD